MIATAAATTAVSPPDARAGSAMAAPAGLITGLLEGGFARLLGLDQAGRSASPPADGLSEAAQPSTASKAAETLPASGESSTVSVLQQLGLLLPALKATNAALPAPHGSPSSDAVPAATLPNTAITALPPASQASMNPLPDLRAESPGAQASDAAAIKTLVDRLLAAADGPPAVATSAASPAEPSVFTVAAPAAAALPESRVVNSPLAPVVIHADDAPQQWSTQIEWTLKAGVQEARIELSPAHLGPVEVRVQNHADGVNVQFSAAQAGTREVLQEQLPRLRESLAANGILLADAQVGQGQGWQTPRESARPAPVRARPERASDADEGSAVTSVQQLRTRGLLDRYA